MMQVSLRKTLAFVQGRSESHFMVNIQDWVMNLSSFKGLYLFFIHTLPCSFWHQAGKWSESITIKKFLSLLKHLSTCHFASFLVFFTVYCLLLVFLKKIFPSDLTCHFSSPVFSPFSLIISHCGTWQRLSHGLISSQETVFIRVATQNLCNGMFITVLSAIF